MVWLGSSDGRYRLAPALDVLWRQLTGRWPGRQWQHSPQTGTIGDQRHLAEGWGKSDHIPFLSPTGQRLPVGAAGGVVRAVDVAANVNNIPGIVTVTDAPDCEALFTMVNSMYAARDPRVWPDGYAMFHHRITDPARPGQFKPTTPQQDPHLYHLHISTSRNPVGFNSTAAWPVPAVGEKPSSGPAVPVGHGTDTAHPVGDGMYEVLQNAQSGAIRMAGLGFWRAPATPDEVVIWLAGPLCTPLQPRDKGGHPIPRVVSDDGMTKWKNIYLNAGQGQ